MRPHVISVRNPLLSSVFRPAGWSAALLLVGVFASRPEAAPELRTERWIGPGVRSITRIRPAGPWVIHVIETDGVSGFVRLGPTFASERGLRAAAVSEQARRATTDARYPIAGVNGDFFAETPGPFEADPVGALVVDGEVIHTPYPRSAFLIFADGHYEIRRLRLAAWVEGPNGARVELKGVNQPCGAGDLILYTPRFGTSTPAKGPITEATLTSLDGLIRLGTLIHARVAALTTQGDAPIPANGVVLSGLGPAGDFLGGLKPGDAVQLQLDVDPPVPPDTDIMGGGPALVRAGRVVVTEDTEGFKPDVVAGRAPRTAVGFNGRRLLLVAVDGRQPGISAGMTLLELASLMRELGCTDAMNLDGGGSTTAWVRGAVVNHPTDGHERRVAEGLFLFSTAPKGPPLRLTIAPEPISILAGAACPLNVSGEDEYYNPVPAPAGPLTWRVDAQLGAVDGAGPHPLAPSGPHPLTPSPNTGGGGTKQGTFLALPAPVAAGGRAQTGAFLSSPSPSIGGGGQGVGAAPRTRLARTAAEPQFQAPAAGPPVPSDPVTIRGGTVRVQCGDLTGSAPVRVYSRPPRLVVIPAGAALLPGGSRQFAAQAVDEWGRPLIISGVPVRWSCPPELGTVDATGLFHAAAAPGKGELTVEIAGTQVAVPVTVGTETRLLDGFETAGRWTGSTAPPEMKGAIALVEAAPLEGQHCLRVEYDFSGGQGTRAVYASAKLPLGRPLALRVWVRGDGGGAWLRARLHDAHGHAQLLDFARHLGRLDAWQELAAPVPLGLPGPLTLEALYLVETDPQAQPQGAIELDRLEGDYAPAGPAGPAPPTPVVRR